MKESSDCHEVLTSTWLYGLHLVAMASNLLAVASNLIRSKSLSLRGCGWLSDVVCALLRVLLFAESLVLLHNLSKS